MSEHKYGNKPKDILSTWIAFEALSFAEFDKEKPKKKESDSQSTEKKDIVKIIDLTKDRVLPWFKKPKISNQSNAQKGDRTYYNIILGTLNKSAALKMLEEVYHEEDPNRYGSKEQEAILAAIAVDDKGKLIIISSDEEEKESNKSEYSYGEKKDKPSDPRPLIDISMVASAFPKALNKKLKELDECQSEIDLLIEELYKKLHKIDKDGEQLPVTWEMMKDAYAHIIANLQLEECEKQYEKEYKEKYQKEYGDSLLNEPRFIKSKSYNPEKSKPQLEIINSRIIDDLMDARSYFEDNDDDEIPHNLDIYLKNKISVKKDKGIDILNRNNIIEKFISSLSSTKSCWLSEKEKSLVLMQQLAVNLSQKELEKEGILAVNGPPGTGKTSLFRDVISEIITKRAYVMSRYDDPRDAFTKLDAVSKEFKNKKQIPKFYLHKVAKKLQGFEILVTSSNNKAVENISLEFPDKESIADGDDLHYFKTIADKLIKAEKPEKEAWGLIAAKLGNRDNIKNFMEEFWWGVGLFSYLRAAQDSNTDINNKVTQNEECPKTEAEAKDRWKGACEAFKHAYAESQKELEELESAKDLAKKCLRKDKDFKEQLRDIQCDIEELQITRETLLSEKKSLEEGKKIQEDLLKSSEKSNWELSLYLLFNPSIYKKYQKEQKGIKHIINDLVKEIQINQSKLAQNADFLNEKQKNQSDLETILLFDGEFIKILTDIGKQEYHKIKPLKELHNARKKVFIKAIELHKAFIDMAAKPLRHNLRLLAHIAKGGTLDGATSGALLDLWISLFLVVPVISSTFASVGTMLKGLPKNALGWLLIDEAGQATPQSAVGALMRTQRAIIVGDPFQIPPVVTLPNELTEAICNKFDIDKEYFNAPKASVQTMADDIAKYHTIIENKELQNEKDRRRKVVIPLLVHYRCSDPMFSISNKIAYGGLMIHGRESNSESGITKYLKKSCWIDVKDSESYDKWSKKEGEVVLRLLQKLVKNKISLEKIYIISPFVNVKTGLTKLLNNNQLWYRDPDLARSIKKNWIENNLGTLHTFQGRENEAVILLLGSQDKEGARKWAGETPNLLNVAVTRAKEVLYVVGSREKWRAVGVFKELERNRQLEKYSVAEYFKVFENIS
ncbi:MAG: hypothetical protein HRU36_04220 [Rickettsiales bacterium]|nr:hypothetical protein [Rickettsiales bacterium]